MGGTIKLCGGITGNSTADSDTAFDSASLVDLLSAVVRYEVALLSIAPHYGLGAVGSGLSGQVSQFIADVSTTLAFKNAISSNKRYDDNEDQDWYSLITEIAILQHPPIKSNPYVVNLEGISWQYNKVDNVEAVWPYTITTKANRGDLDRFLTKQDISGEKRREICAQILSAVKCLHDCGVAHGDIKPKNVIVHEDNSSNLSCRLIDFGGAAIVGQERLPQVTMLWKAPELPSAEHRRGPVSANSIIKADLYSLGLLISHILIPKEYLISANFCLLESSGSCATAEIFKASTGFQKEKLSDKICAVAAELQIPPSNLEILIALLPPLLQNDPNNRHFEASEYSRLFFDGIPTSEDNMEAVQQLLPVALSYAKLGPCIHEVFELMLVFGELDDLDYILRKDIAEDMLRKAGLSDCTICKRKYAVELSMYYRIGFGVPRNLKKSGDFLKETSLSESLISAKIKLLSDEYQVLGPVSGNIGTELGIGVALSVDLAQKYHFQGRLKVAEKSIRLEIIDRELEFGTSSLCGVKLRTDLVQIHRIQNRLLEAEEQQREVVNIYTNSFDESRGFALRARMFLAEILIEQGYLLKAERELEQVVDASEGVGERIHTVFELGFLGDIRLSQGRYEDAADIFSQISKIRQKTNGEIHPSTLRAETDLASALCLQGLLIQAKDLMAKVSKKASSIGDPLIQAMATINLVDIYSEQGSLESAEREAFRAINLLKGQLEEGDSLRLISLDRLAKIYGKKRDFSRQEGYLRQAREGRRAYDERNPYLIKSNLDLVINLMAQGRLEESLIECKGVLSRLGSDATFFPRETIEARDLLAALYWLTGERNEAESQHRELLDLMQNSFDDSHPFTMSATISYAAFLGGQGRWHESTNLLSSAMDVCRNTGRRAGIAIDLGKKLAIAYRELNKFNDSVARCKEAIEWSTEAMGEKHETTLSLQSILASTYLYMGAPEKANEVFTKLSLLTAGTSLEMYVLSEFVVIQKLQGNIIEAKKISARALETTKRLRDTDHPDVLKARGQLLGLRLSHEPLTEELDEEAVEVIKSKIRTYGPANPTTIKTVVDLANALTRVGSLERAEELFSTIERLDVGKHLQNSMKYATYLGQRADLYYRRGQLEETAKLERQALEIRERCLEKDNPTILITMSNLASTLFGLGKLDEAEELSKHVLAARMNQLGEDHSLTLDTKNDLAGIMFAQGRLEEAVVMFKDNVERSEKINERPEKLGRRKAELEVAQAKIWAKQEQQITRGKSEC